MAAVQSNPSWDALVELDPAVPGPFHERLTRAIREAIRAGRIPPGGALPPTRRLAADLGCSRWVVVQAYEQLGAEGYVEGRTGSATRVRSLEGAAIAPVPPATAATTAAARLDLGPGIPDLRAFPRRAWLDALRAELASAPYPELAYPEPGGHPRLRSVLAAYLRRVRGAVVDPRDVTVTSGVIDGMTQVWRALADSGRSVVAVEDPGWAWLRNGAAKTGLTLVPVPVDDDGLRVEELVGRRDVAAVVVSPAHQFPSGAVLAPARRRMLVDWARSSDVLILEDDYDAEFRYDRRPVGTVQGVEPSRVALFGSLSKTMAPAMGLGWAVTPPRWTEAIRSRETRMTGPPVVDQLALARFIESGAYDRHLRVLRRTYRLRRDRLVDGLRHRIPDARVAGVAAGLHILVWLPPGVRAAVVQSAAEARGLAVMDLAACRVRADGAPEGLVLGYGNLDDGVVDAAVRALAAAVRDAADPDVASLRRG